MAKNIYDLTTLIRELDLRKGQAELDGKKDQEAAAPRDDEIADLEKEIFLLRVRVW